MGKRISGKIHFPTYKNMQQITLKTYLKKWKLPFRWSTIIEQSWKHGEKRWNCLFEQFLLSSSCFQKASIWGKGLIVSADNFFIISTDILLFKHKKFYFFPWFILLFKHKKFYFFPWFIMFSWNDGYSPSRWCSHARAFMSWLGDQGSIQRL